MTTKMGKKARKGAKIDDTAAPEARPEESQAPVDAVPEQNPVHAELAGSETEVGSESPAAQTTSPVPEEPSLETSVTVTAEVPKESAVAESETAPEPETTAPSTSQEVAADDDDDPDDEDETQGRDCELREKVEALLFSAPKPLRSAEIAEFCSVSKDETRSALRSLRADYRKRKTGLEIVKIDGRYQMRVRRGAEEAARLVAPTDISRDLLKTITVIAFYQPMLQSELVEMVGSKVYDQVRELEERKLIRSAPYAQTKVLGTGLVFAEYFGLKTGQPEEVRKWVAKRLGREPPAPRLKLTPALMAAEAALDPAFVAGRSVESPPLPEETAPLTDGSPADQSATQSSPPSPATEVSTEVGPAVVEPISPNGEPQSPAES